MHTDTTVGRLRGATEYLGGKLRYFVKHITPTYRTKELPREEAARVRRKKGAPTDAPQTTKAATGTKLKLLNLITYKLHALGDYVAQILLFGTSDSYSTQPVSNRNE